MTIHCRPAEHIKYANGFRRIISVICNIGAVQLIQNHRNTDVAVRKRFTSNTRLIIPDQTFIIKGEITKVLGPFRISQNNIHFALRSQLIIKANNIIIVRRDLQKALNTCCETQLQSCRFCSFRFSSLLRFGGFRLRFFHRALDVIDITVGCGPAVYIKYTDGFRCIIPVIHHTCAIQLIQYHCYVDIAVIQLLGGNTGLIFPYQAIGIEFKAAVVLAPIRCAEHQGHLAFGCQLIIEVDHFIIRRL